MRNLDNALEKLNFKKTIKLYLIFAVIAGISSAILLGYAFKDKLLFAYNYSKVSEKIEDGRLGVDVIKADLATLAGKSADIADILILDKDNKVTFSARNSEFAAGGKFTLERGKYEENRYLTYTQNPDVNFKLVRKDELMLSTVLADNEKDIEHNHDDSTFFENNFNSKKIYLLSYTANKRTGDKIYFISDVRPVANGSLYIKIVGALAMLFFMLYWVLLALWVYQNAKKAKSNAVLWGVITLFTNLAGLFIYLIYKQNNQTCFKCGATQNKRNIFCTYCGAKISRTCNKCNEIINEGDNFCSRCGSSITNDEKSE
ncbi:MAG: zinc ribbon domain-containing protein [Caulobacteraceae bacterium]